MDKIKHLTKQIIAEVNFFLLEGNFMKTHYENSTIVVDHKNQGARKILIIFFGIKYKKGLT